MVHAVFLDYGSLDPGDLDSGPLTRLLPDLRLHDVTTPDELAERMREAEIVFVNKVPLDRELLASSPRLRLVCLAATGTDNVDIAAARENGIAVCNIRAYCTPSVTQHVFGMLLELTLHLGHYRSLVGSGDWSRGAHFCLLDLPSRELAGKTLGVIGLGTLGGAVAGVGRAFGMEVLAARRPYRLSDDFESAVADDGHVQRVGLGALLARAHVVSLHCPLTAETKHLIDARSLARMRSDAVLINTARGGLIDSDALITALRDKRLAGAGIDVLDQEPPPADHPLLGADLPELLVTPHIAWAARESRQRAIDELAENAAAFLAGKKRNRVD